MASRGLFRAVLAALLTLPASASGATIRVTTLADDFGAGKATCSLREGVQAANTNAAFGGCRRGRGADTVVLRSGKSYDFTRAGGDDANQVGDLDIASRITIEPNHRKRPFINAATLSRVLDVAESGRLKVSRLVITGGLAAAGEGYEGGGIRNFGGRLDVIGSRIASNQATGLGNPNGGGISARGGTTKVMRSVVTGNRADNVGGGVSWAGGPLKVIRSTIVGNHSDYHGGGLYLGGYGDRDVDRFRLKASTVSGNDADDSAGGISLGLYGPSSAKATNVTISGNYTNGYGGGINQSAGDLTLNAATVTNNTADIDASGDGQGGGISGFGIQLHNSIIAGNHNPHPTTPMPDCFNGGGVANNLVGLGGGCVESGSNTAVADPKLKPLSTYGGPTQTHALKPGSKAIGRAGSSAPKSDQRGVRRDGKPDIGAFER